ncbi:hypothetical protein Dimus_019218 [Dionaea muscipula]
MDEAAEGVGDGGDPTDQFHRNEAISAVADEGFLVEEDDDYEDLYNDVNVGEGFLQSLRKNEELGFRNEEVKAEPPALPQPQPAIAPSASAGLPVVSVGGGEGERMYERDFGGGMSGGETGSRVSGGRMDGYQNQGFKGNDVGGSMSVPPGGGGGGVVGGGYGGGGGLRVELGPASSKVPDVQGQPVNHSMPIQGMVQPQQPQGVHGSGNVDTVVRQIGVGTNMNGMGGNIGGPASGIPVVGGPGGGNTILFVGDLHWWTTDAELERELVTYGPVKEVKFFEEKASGKSKGYCQVEFYDGVAAAACKEGMNGHAFNGRPCVVAFASPHTIKRMGEAQVNRNQQNAQQPLMQGRRGPNDGGNKTIGNNISTGGNYQGGDNNRGYGRGNWGRGNGQGMGNRGPVGPMRNRPSGMGGRGMMGNGGNGFPQGMGATPPMMHPQAMMGQGFDPAFGGPMGRMGGYGGFPGAPTPPFPGLLSPFPPLGSVGMPGVAPHVNPAFFGRGMPMNGMGMMPNSGLDGPNMGMWPDPSMGGWNADEHGRVAESSYGEEVASDHQYGDANHDRSGWPNTVKEKERGSERDWSGTSDRRYRDDREPGHDREMPRESDVAPDRDWPDRRHRDDRDVGRDNVRERDRERERSRDRDRDRDRDRERHRDERDRYAENHKYRESEPEHDDEWERGRASRTHNKTRLSHEEEHHSRSRDADYAKRRRQE